ncbi:hypothetical protein HK104_005060, partial [Borealophlyctis nickersoniae]
MSTQIEDEASWETFVDVHNHVIDTPDTLHLVPTLQTPKMILMGTRPEDWDAVADAAAKWPDRIIPAFGTHPWFAHTVPPPPSASESTSLEETNLWTRLRHLLTTHPMAMVGEIGIDGVARDRSTGVKYPFDHQMSVFRAQMDIAAELGRPVNVHVVQCHGHLLNYLMEIGKRVGV